MDGRIDVSTLLFLVLAVVIFLKLRSVLGRRTGHEQTRFERYKAQQEASQRNGNLAGKDKVVTLPRREREEVEPRAAAEPQAWVVVVLESRLAMAFPRHYCPMAEWSKPTHQALTGVFGLQARPWTGWRQVQESPLGARERVIAIPSLHHSARLT